MAFNKQSDFINAFLATALLLVPGITTTNVDCKGKAFHCVNSTHFKICVDFGGVSKTVDDFLIPCPPSTKCTDSNYYECEIPTTSAPLARQSDVTNELFETTVTSPWELLDVITLSPINNNEKSVEWLENSTIASPDIVSTAAGTETVETVNYNVVNEVINEITTESEYIIDKTTTSDLSESNYSNAIPNSYMASLAITDETNDLGGHNISANITSPSVTIGNNSSTESKIWMDVFDSMTTSSSTKDDAYFKSTNLFNSVITDRLNKNNLTAALTTESYSGTKSEISIDHKSFITAFPDADKISTTLSFPLKSNDLRVNIAEEASKNYEVTEFDTSISMLEQVETTPKNIEGSDDFATTISSVPLKTDDFGLKSSLATGKSGTENETFITNNKVNTHFTTTLLVPLMTESLQNTPNIEINLSVTSDSYSTSTEQYSSDKNYAIETTTATNDMYTIATVTGTGAGNETMIMNNNVNPDFTKTTLSAPMITEGLLNTSNIEIDLTVTYDSYSTSTEQYSTVSYKYSPTETATTTNEMYTNANVNGIGTENKTLMTNNKVNPYFTTTLSAPMIIEGLVNTPNIEIYLSDTSDSSTSFEQFPTESDTKNPTETATTTNELFTNANVNGTGTENKTMITNNKVNPHFTTTTLSAPMIIEGLVNTPNIEIYLSDTSDSYSTNTEQYSTVSYKNSPTETATTTNKMYSNANVNGTGTENKTLITNNKVNPHFTTTLSAPMVTEVLVNTPNIANYLSDTSDSSTGFEQFPTVSDTNTPTETATNTNELYTNANVNGIGTENKTLIMNNKVNAHFTTTTLSAPMIIEGLVNTPNIEIYLSDTPDSYSTSTEQYSTVNYKNSPTETATTTNEMYANATATGIGTTNETLITNNEVNPHFTTTTLSAPIITESLINSQNIKINFTVPSDSNSAGTEQYSTVRDNNSPIETSASTNQMYTNNVTKTSDSRLDGYSLNENDMNMNKIDKISSSSLIQIEFNSTTTENVVLRDTLQVFSINEQNNLSSPVESVVSLNAENLTSSDRTKFTTVTDLNETNTQANVLYTKAPIVNENIILDTDGTSTTKLEVTINENNLMRENTANLSTDIILITRSDSSETNVPENTPDRDTNSRSPTTKNVSDTYTTVTNKKIQVDEFSIYENDLSTIPLSDFPSTIGYDKELHSKTAVNIVSKHTTPTILTKEQSDISPQKSENHAIIDLINNEPLKTTTLQPQLTIDLTVNYISYDVNLSKPTVNGNKLHKNVAKKISNNTKEEILRHENGTYENIIDEITTPLPQIADIKSTAKAENVAASFIGSLNDTVQELQMTGTSDLSPPVTNGSPSVSEIIKTSLLSDITESYYVVNTEPHIDVTKVKLPIFSTIDETIQNNPTTQNIVTETLDGTEDEHGSTRNFEIQQHEKNTTFDSVSSMFLHFSKHNDNSTEPFDNRLKENDSYSKMMYGSSHPLNLSNSTSKSNTKYIAEHNTEHSINLTIIGNLTATSAIQQRITLNDTGLNLSALETIFNLTVGNAITPTEYQKSTVNNAYDNIITTHSYIRDGTGESSHLTEGDILKTTLLNENSSMNTLGTDLNSSALIRDRYNSVFDDIIINESPKYHKNNNTYNFTKQINNSVVVNTNANLYNANVKNIKFKITEKKQNQTLDPVSKSIVNFNNLSINVENLTRHDQNSSYKNVPNKTRIGDMQLHFVINADKKQSLSNPVQANEDKRKVNITKITPVKVNNLPSNEIERTEFKFNCDSRQRGKYSDKNDCQNFYICTGRVEPIIGKCPNNTVFSEILKQCTRNLSHCIRNNQFQCISAGRFVDILSDKFYYICAKKVKGYIRFKFQCQKGYHLDQSKLKCILDTNESLSLDMDSTNEESSKTDGEESTIESRSQEEKDSKKQKKDFECKKEGNFLYPDDCRKYYHCTKTGESKFRRKIKKCDSDEVFDSEMRKCVDEESYEC